MYLSSTHQNIVDPLLNYQRIRFDEGAAVVGETDLGGIFERVYSVAALRRILLRDEQLRFTLYRIQGLDRLTEDRKSPVFRVRYALLIQTAA